MQSSIRSRVTRLRVPSATYFITTNTGRQQPIFRDPFHVSLLRQTLHQVREQHRFSMRAYVFLPDHLHLLLQLRGNTDICALMQSLKRNFTLNYKEHHRIQDRVRLWQRSFYDHVIRDDTDYFNHLDYIHRNPVKHGYVDRPEDYPHSSYMEYVRRGWYALGWGHKSLVSSGFM